MKVEQNLTVYVKVPARTLRMTASNRKSRKQTRKMARWNFNKAPKGK